MASVMLAILGLPTSAHATGMDGLAVIVYGMLVAGPALLVLAVLLGVVLLAGKEPKGWHGPFAIVSIVLSPILAAAYPLTLARDKTEFFVMALVLDVPLLVLAIFVIVLSFRLKRRAA